MIATSASKIARLKAPSTALFVVDIQQRFRDKIHAMDAVIGRAGQLLDAASILQLPLTVVGEQYPKGLGHTVDELQDKVAALGVTVEEKTKFSLFTSNVETQLSAAPIENVVVCGIEAHVCVLQTVLDLSERGFGVHVCCDAVSSMTRFDRQYAFERMKAIDNVYLTTSQSVLFQLLGDAKHPHFKQISALVREEQPDPQL